jgi:hypothetical protein
MAKSRRKDSGMTDDRGAVMAAATSADPHESAPQAGGDTTVASIDRERLAARAYELYLARGGSDGQDMEDWLVAERELLGSRDQASKQP